MNKEENDNLQVVDDLLSVQEKCETEENEKVEILSLDSLTAFKGHPFKVTQNEDFKKLVDSIKENGVLVPAIARPKGGGYELIAGHRRKAACELLGLKTMPVLVREMTNEQAVIFMVDSNVQRENVLPSEKAFAYKMKMDALNRQGKRAESASTPVVSKSRSNEIVGGENGESREQVRRYIRLTELIPQLLQMVDDGKIAFRPAVELSYLPKEQQKQLLSVTEAEQSTPSLAQAQKLKDLSADGALDELAITSLMREQKGNQCEYVRIPCEKIRSILKTDTPVKDLEELILRAVTEYKRKLVRQQDRGAR